MLTSTNVSSRTSQDTLCELNWKKEKLRHLSTFSYYQIKSPLLAQHLSSIVSRKKVILVLSYRTSVWEGLLQQDKGEPGY